MSSPSEDLRAQVSVLWPYLSPMEKLNWCENVAWAESGGRKDLEGNVTSPGSTKLWPEVALDMSNRERAKNV